MDLTVNPDFSQIEADVPQIDFNQRFALYYPEKRPFFLEGMEVFRFPEIQMVYTRRIIDPIAGAKLTGKVGRFTYGLLSAYDTSPIESLWEVHNGGSSQENNALFNIFRMKADVLKESYIGFSLTDKEIDGSFNRVDYRTFGVYTYAAVYPEKKYLNQARFNLRAGRRFDYDMDVLEDEWISQSIQLRFTEFSQMNFSYRFEMEHYGGVDFIKNSFTASGELIFLSWLPFGFSVRTGDSIFYINTAVVSPEA